MRSDSNPMSDDEAAPLTDEQLLAAYLANHLETCPACGYLLKALRGGNCPECGRALQLRVGKSGERMAAFLLGAVSIGGLATVSLWTISTLIFYYRDGISTYMPHFPRMFLIEGAWLALSTLVLVVLLAFGRRFRKLTTRRQWSLAIGCVLLHPIKFVMWFL